MAEILWVSKVKMRFLQSRFITGCKPGKNSCRNCRLDYSVVNFRFFRGDEPQYIKRGAALKYSQCTGKCACNHIIGLFYVHLKINLSIFTFTENKIY